MSLRRTSFQLVRFLQSGAAFQPVGPVCGTALVPGRISFQLAEVSGPAG
jgi:hypothetical protein